MRLRWAHCLCRELQALDPAATFSAVVTVELYLYLWTHHDAASQVLDVLTKPLSVSDRELQSCRPAWCVLR